MNHQFVTRPPLLRLLPDELIVDSFAGGGWTEDDLLPCEVTPWR